MKRYVVDAGVVLHLLEHGADVSGCKLLAPTLVRSQVLSLLHEAVYAGELDESTAKGRLARLSEIPMRLLGDSRLRRRAWDVADELGLASTYVAEYVALTQLQGDAFVTLDKDLGRSLSDLVPLATVDELSL